MSAFVCHSDHIRALAVYAAQSDGGGVRVPPYILRPVGGRNMDSAAPDELATYYASVLYRENRRSVCTRYRETMPTLEDDCFPVGIRAALEPVRLSPVAILKMCACLEYQSCETSDYRETLAHALLGNIRRQATQALPGYDAAMWEYIAPGSQPAPEPTSTTSRINQLQDARARAFAIACYDSNSGSELIGAAMTGPDESDMQAWDIDESQYFAAISAALSDMEQDERQAARMRP